MADDDHGSTPAASAAKAGLDIKGMVSVRLSVSPYMVRSCSFHPLGTLFLRFPAASNFRAPSEGYQLRNCHRARNAIYLVRIPLHKPVWMKTLSSSELCTGLSLWIPRSTTDIDGFGDSKRTKSTNTRFSSVSHDLCSSMHDRAKCNAGGRLFPILFIRILPFPP